MWVSVCAWVAGASSQQQRMVQAGACNQRHLYIHTTRLCTAMDQVRGKQQQKQLQQLLLPNTACCSLGVNRDPSGLNRHHCLGAQLVQQPVKHSTACIHMCAGGPGGCCCVSLYIHNMPWLVRRANWLAAGEQ
jgi:hypothetical protein